MSEGGATVATPLSLMEWFDKFYVETKKGPVRPFEASYFANAWCLVATIC